MFSEKKIDTTHRKKRIDKEGHLDAIRHFLIVHVSLFEGIVLDVGCGDMPYKALILEANSAVTEYIGLDLESGPITRNAAPDLTWDGQSIPLLENSVECAVATEVFEHCEDPGMVMREIYRVLKPSGTLIFTVPFLWPLHEVPYDHYRFTPFALERLLKAAGFTEIELMKLGGWDAALAQMLGLWVIRRPGLNRVFRKCLEWSSRPIIALLNRTDRAGSDFSESQMLTGIGGVARK